MVRIKHRGLAILALLACAALFPPGLAWQLPPNYRSRDALLQAFFDLMNRYPAQMTYESIGKSYRGNDMPMFKVGNPNGGKVLFTTVTHGDEIQSLEVGYYMAKWILERTEPQIADRILRYNLIMIVAYNIDAYSDTVKRKNMHLYGYVPGDNPDFYGVDLNRNMPTGWGGIDSDSDVTSMHYRGPGPASEPESQAFIRMLEKYRPKFQLDYHFGGGFLFGKPSAYARMSTTMSEYHDAIASKIRTLSASRNVRVFEYGQLGISGCVADQAYVSGNSVSYLLEAGTYTPTYSQIESVNMPELLPFLIVFAQESEIFETRYLVDNFESGDFSSWTGTYISPGETAIVAGTLPYQGMFSAKFASDGTGGFEAAYSYVTVPDSPRLYACGYFCVSTSGFVENKDCIYFIRFLADGNSVAYAGWERIGGVDRWSLIIRDSTGWANAYSKSSPSQNRWYSLEIYWVRDSVNGLGELYVDGTLQCSISGKNTAAFDYVDQARFGLAEVCGCEASTIYSDSCQISRFPVWDVNQDGTVDMRDISTVARAFISIEGYPNWNPSADTNADGTVDMKDVSTLARHFDEQYL